MFLIYRQLAAMVLVFKAVFAARYIDEMVYVVLIP